MNLFKKLMTGVAVGALTLAVAGGIGSVSASAKAMDVVVDYDNQALVVTPSYTTKLEGESAVNSYAKEVLVSFPKVTFKNDAYTVKETAWDTYEVKGGAVVVDLSTLKPDKENYVAVKDSDTDKAVIIKIQAAPVLKGSYNVGAHKATFTTPGADKKPVDYKGAVLYRTAVGNWAVYEDVDMSTYEQQGATLYFKAEGSDGMDELKAITAGVPDAYTMKEAGSFAGKEVKVKAKKLGNAPAVAADYVNKTFKVAKGCEYRFNYASEWTKVATAAAVVAMPSNDAGVFEVRKSVTTNKTGVVTAAESKIGRLVYGAAPTVATTNADSATYASIATTSGAVAVEVEVDGDNVKLTNKSVTVYEVIVSEAKVTQAELVAKKTTDNKKLAVTAVKAKTAKGNTVVTLKKATGKYIYVRIAGDKKAATWASDYELLNAPAAE